MDITKVKIITVFFALGAVSVHAEDEIKIPHVSAYGTAEIKVVPDEMHWNLEVKTNGVEVAKVAEVHDKKVEAVLKFLMGQKIEAKKIQTSRIQLSEHRVRRNGDYVKEGYDASTEISFETGDLEKYRSLWLGVSKIQDVSVKGVAFQSSERIKHQNESRLKAVKAAKEKAAALAKALDSSIHEPFLIEEKTQEVWPGMFNARNTGNNISSSVFASGSQGGGLAPGTISVTTRVQVKFRISTP